ncbi:MAG: NUDIX domain-containing protein [Candidatus Aminicenantes bacterium]|nr:NUDIX domain-containing protein [Candidatus Aminicenantes bacterium]
MEYQEVWRSLEARLKKPKPGLPAQLDMAPDPRPGQKVYHEVLDTCLHAGVLVLLYPIDGQLQVLLTRRTDRVLHHRAQISFPGGQQEPDEDLMTTALRETQEELGIDTKNFRELGNLTPLYIPPSNYCIYPLVAAAESRPAYHPSPKEVAEVIEIPLLYLLDEKNRTEQVWRRKGQDVKVPFYSFKHHKIWGATAMVLAELLAIMTEIIRDSTRQDC